MSWGLRFRVRQYVKGSLWAFPVLGGVAGSLIGVIAAETGTIFELSGGWTYSAGTAETVLAAIVGASVGLTGFVVTVSVLIVQMAAGALLRPVPAALLSRRSAQGGALGPGWHADVLLLDAAPGGAGLPSPTSE